jgi:hypothetical protein
MNYVVDIDGTIADATHRLHFIEGAKKDWNGFFNACGQDAPIQHVIEVIRGLDLRHNIIYVTGRPERIRVETVRWLKQHHLPYNRLNRTPRLHMRADGDYRVDTIAKKELLQSLQRDGITVDAVFEDRPSVCRVWRSMGIPVFQMTDREF